MTNVLEVASRLNVAVDAMPTAKAVLLVTWAQRWRLRGRPWRAFELVALQQFNRVAFVDIREPWESMR